MPARTEGDASFQALFERRWSRLTRPHVRALAWLLDAPDLLDAAAPPWQGRIASLGPLAAASIDWLHALERDPAPLDEALGTRFYSRLGLYAEKLMAFYFAQHGSLVAHGLQVRASRNDTVGEFDFLLRDGARLLHWEFATKFYLLDEQPDNAGFNCLIGPNLADTLGAKMRKILDKQLALARHPAAQPLLPQPVDLAQALVKGWLFYPPGRTPALAGIGAPHCHGFWSALARFEAADDERFIVLPRLQWLAPWKGAGDTPVLNPWQLRQALTLQMETLAAPVMVAAVVERGGWLVERRRGFVVPDDWQAQAAARRTAGLLPA
ncbi:DUF1853 family protein [Rugamonas sp. CCM 8940]|uniref:DUF1853 family protein n=1 Tax=Rugamonas sp. CCM 8940 TaxID=2765359 RepID=UPI0018F6FB43|nr:DUF1853 family protein [Rugamonas sp. CCM 8940]MBJ7313021.1 DUF1853 family protein [Rugamonas sp. CCM 8940]